MAAKGTKVTQKEVYKMVELYQELGSYKKVAKKLRRSPDTVAKYIQQWEVSQLTVDALQRQGITKAQYMPKLQNDRIVLYYKWLVEKELD